MPNFVAPAQMVWSYLGCLSQTTLRKVAQWTLWKLLPIVTVQNLVALYHRLGLLDLATLGCGRGWPCEIFPAS